MKPWCALYVLLSRYSHDDVIKWKHFPRYWPFVRGIHLSPVNSAHKGQRRGALMFFFIYARINSWVNTGEAGDLRRHDAHYDGIAVFYGKAVMDQSPAVKSDHEQLNCDFPHCWASMRRIQSSRASLVFRCCTLEQPNDNQWTDRQN